ncbi:oxidoreductase [Sphaerisporangium krabiense]|uniref:NAD(P)-dependent dehydrogenase (Short-subunit alcohol dehydrogenase family) n=1 Tax=Sphaerisporangium krabiense TaxID=763782 RepID=A0A7W8Z4M1_9ACTN|nr:SDR family oxidoreductase [Sphaerisporangium krabiense]MBB5627135.1 NAD(P)-dependent dehydrogenase (short-subunit alcohol dehydrogenase family) [Sphaerisporangium krabiense]GII65294.1 oxidoreductase [Sphaerisporangium krabiense]
MTSTTDARVAVVTGAGGDIGGACAARLAAFADVVVCVDLDAARARDTVRDLTGRGGRAVALSADATDPGFGATVAEAVRPLGRATAVVHAVAHEEHAPAETLGRASVERSLAAGPLAAYGLFTELLLTGRLGPGSALTVIGSLHADRPFAGCLGYNAAHGALAQVVRTLAHEWTGRGIRVNAVVPGWIRTRGEEVLYDPAHLDRVAGSLPMGRFGTPADVAGAVAYLSSPEAAYVSGAFLEVDGGLAASLARLPGGELS